MANKDQENEKANDNQTRDLRYAEDSDGLAKTSDFRRSLAVIIGIDDYQRGVPRLKTGVNDARRLAEVLDEDYGYDDVKLFTQDVTLAKLKALLTESLPAQVDPDDRVLFYFAGHGVALDGDDGPAGYLVPQDARPEDRDTFLPMHELHEALAALHCRHLLTILDCCFAGAFRWSSTRALLPVPAVIHQERYERFIRDPAWQVITSAAYDQKALDVLSGAALGDRGDASATEHSPFALALFEALAGAGDVVPKEGGDGVITATELYLYLRDYVEIKAEDEARHRQTPGIWPLNKHDKGEYIFLVPGHELNLPPAPELTAENNPYRGLKPYEERHSDLFFGRDELIEKLAKAVESQPLTVVLGASGTGKSSLVKAGLVPYLRGQGSGIGESGIRGSGNQGSGGKAADRAVTEEQASPPEGGWHILPPLRPSASPLRALANLLNTHLTVPGQSVRVAGLRNNANTLADQVATWCQANPGRKLLLVIDQLEELITLCRVERERTQFLSLVCRAVETQPEQLRLVLTLRSDFEPQFSTSGLAAHWSPARFFVTPMSQDDLREVIEGPASVRVLYFEPYELVEDLINEVVRTPGALPLLSFTLSELYIKYLESVRDNRALAGEDYQALGGVVGALRNRATEEYAALDAKHQATMRRIMLRMIAVEGGELARRRVPRSELVYADEDENGRVEVVIARLVAARLVVEGREEGGEETYVEPAHDALMRAWDKLLVWKGEAEEYLPLQRRLAQAARDWDRALDEKTRRGLLWNNDPRLPQLQQMLEGDVRHQGSAGLLRRAARTLRLSEFAPRESHWLNRAEMQFVQESVRQRVKNLRRLIATILVVFLALSLLTVIAFDQRNQFQTESNLRATEIQVRKTAESNAVAEGDRRATQQRIAEEALATSQARGTAVAEERDNVEGLRLAALADGVLGENGNVETSALLAIRSLNTAYSPQAEAALVQALDRLHTWGIFPVSDYSAVSDVAFSPDGGQVLLGGEGSARLLDIETGAEQGIFHSPTGAVTSVAYSPDGRYVLAGTGGSYLDTDYSVRLWDVATGEELGAFSGHKATVDQAMFSPNGRHALTGSYREMILWDLETGQELYTFPGSYGDFSLDGGYTTSGTRGAFSPDGSQLLISGREHAQLWDINTASDVQTFSGSGGMFSPDGGQVITYDSDAGAGLTAQVWDAATGELLRTFSIPEAGSIPSQLSPDGRHAVTLDDGTASVWDLETGEQIRLLSGHTGTVTRAVFSPDGRYVLTGGADGSARLWTIFDEDNPLGGQAAHRFANDHAGVTSVAFSPDGAYVLTGGVDGVARIWDVMTGQVAHVLEAYPYEVTSVAFSPDGSYVLTAGITGFEEDLVESDVRLWDGHTGELLRVFEGLRDEGEITSAVFSPDGGRVLIGSMLGTALLWDVETGEEVAILYAVGTDQVTSVAFSPDGKQVLVASHDDMFDDGFLYTQASLLDAETGEELGVFSGDSDILSSVAFSPDASQILIGSESGRAWLASLGLPEGEEEITHVFSSHSDIITSVAFSPDGHYALTGSRDGTARLWDTATGAEVRVFSGHTDAVNSVAFSRDGRYALTGSRDGTARLWDTDYRDFINFACTRVFRDFTYGEGDFRDTGNEWRLYGVSDDTPTCPKFGGS